MSTRTLSNRLDDRAAALDTLLCIGLDPHAGLLQERSPAAVRAFCTRLIEATSGLALAYKPNSAFFEALGPAGMQVLQDVIKAASREALVILDAKRADIADTSVAYADAAFRTFGADAVTVNPYLGHDALEPFLADPEHGAFVLCKTSNPSSDEFQSLPSGGLSLYEQVALRAQTWNTADNVGLVAGATDTAALRRCRVAAPGLWFLTPGVGAQGGQLDEALEAGLRHDGSGMLVSVSRSVATAHDPGREALRLVEAIRERRRALTRPDRAPAHVRELADLLLDCGCVRFGDFLLKSGKRSPIYIDLRVLVSFPRALGRVASMYASLLGGLSFDRIAGLPYAGLPIGTAVAMAGDWPMVYARSEAKSYGTRSAVEGSYKAGDVVVLIDDVATTGGAKLEALEKLRQVGLVVHDAVVLVDRESGAGETLAASGLRLSSVARLSQLLNVWRSQGKITDEQVRMSMESC